MIALEEAGANYEPRVIRYMQGEHRTSEYLSLNPNGKTPLLVVDGQPIPETSAILHYLDQLYPDASLMPRRDDAVQAAQDLADLIWCSSELHPNVFRIRIPQFFCDVPGGRERQREMAVADMHKKFAIIEARLSDQPWYLGKNWSAVDGYLMWVWFRLQGTIFDSSQYPKFADHYDRIQQRPAVQRASAREQEAGEMLRARGEVVDFETFRPGDTPADFQKQLTENNQS